MKPFFILQKGNLGRKSEKLYIFFVYGFVFLINRVEADRIDVFVDRWPEFRVLLVRPVKQEENDFYKGISIFTTDEASLKNKLLQTDILDWTQYNCLSFDIGHAETVKAVAAQKGVPETQLSMCHMMILQNPSKLQTNRILFLCTLVHRHITICKSVNLCFLPLSEAHCYCSSANQLSFLLCP
uniref:Glycine N-acyltransferase-like protein n=1 Tax=Astyanax mexicanus TaxID=7994 RepID=A0A8B9HLS2_ASTMX